MHSLWKAARSVLAVLAGIVATMLVAFGMEVPARMLALQLFPRTFPDQAALDSSIVWMLSQSLYTVPALILGGYVAAWLAPRRGIVHSIAMAVVQELLIVALMFNPPHPVPPLMWLFTLTLTPIAIIIGGYLHSRRQSVSPPKP